MQAYSTQFLSNDPLLKWGSDLFHVGIILVFFGHIFGLLAPEWSYDWLITNEQKRQLAIVMGSGAGLITLVGICLLTLRRFTNSRVVANSHFGDYLFVVLIFLQIVTGLMGTVETVNSDLDHSCQEPRTTSSMPHCRIRFISSSASSWSSSSPLPS